MDHQHSLKDELLHVDDERCVLKERITEEGEAAKRERRNADRKKSIDGSVVMKNCWRTELKLETNWVISKRRSKNEILPKMAKG